MEIFTEQLASLLPEIRVFSYSPPRQVADSPSALVKVGLEHPRRAWIVAQEFLREHRRRPYDLAICNGLFGWPLAILKPDIPMIEVYHFTMAGLAEKGLAIPGDRFVTHRVGGFFDALAGRGKHVVAVNGNVLEEVRRFYGLDGKVIPNGVDVHLFKRRNRDLCRAELSLPAEARIGVYVGRAEFAKGFDILLQVIQSMRDVLFVIVGECLATEPNMLVRTSVPHAQMPSYYSAADFLILPSRYEGFNLTILEALACDVPIVVSSPAYPLREQWGGLGSIVASSDPWAYVTAIEGLPAIPQVGVSRERIVSRYSLECFAENWRAQLASVS